MANPDIEMSTLPPGVSAVDFVLSDTPEAVEERAEDEKHLQEFSDQARATVLTRNKELLSSKHDDSPETIVLPDVINETVSRSVDAYAEFESFLRGLKNDNEREKVIDRYTRLIFGSAGLDRTEAIGVVIDSYVANIPKQESYPDGNDIDHDIESFLTSLEDSNLRSKAYTSFTSLKRHLSPATALATVKTLYGPR